jgi:DNA-binding MarR family transcriptional regulator
MLIYVRANIKYMLGEIMSKITVKKSKNYTSISNVGLRDVSISFKAKGVLVYLLHLPNDWNINLADLSNRSTDGRDSVSSAINELIDKKYITRTQTVDDKGRFNGYDYTIYEEPFSD